MELMEAIVNRRSIRNFEDRDVSDEQVTQMLEAVKWAQSWANTQCWEVIVVRDQGVKQKLQATLAKGNPATKSMVQAPVVFVLCGRLKAAGYYKGQVTTKFGDWFMFDLGIAAQNLCLRAHDLGLGSVIVGLFDHDEAKKILQVPEGYEVVVMIPVGYPAKVPSAPKRREISEFTHYEKF
ncbi:nitroreductase family protein [Thermodesulforhabdus norvegica]|uniref:Nitroreductase n=1 Tax=Thermodesulforhabdus norvegica TaxID=39841 RepID=A0A1I4WCB6_9BACT|nr:nitroreductase family protein [Thermodesulforhabdus norvegica]SFN10900.1 Nitroreductase [Thermodesulforhabdus norvegica]